jgi:O-methyltransferase involved in polyketide biosynthesis
MATSEKYAPNLDGVAETLTITLYARCAETARSHPLLVDNKAAEIAQKMDYDLEKYASGWASQLGCVLRIKTFDDRVRDFLTKHPDAVILNLGVGLCTRFSRLDNGQATWYEVDFPEVIDLRRKLMPERERQIYIPSSIFDFNWLEQIDVGNRPVLAIAEGVCPYLTEAENRSLFKALGDRFPGATFLCDMLNVKMAKRTKKHDTVSKTNAEFKFGIDRIQDLETWGDNYTLLDSVDMADLMIKNVDRMPIWARIFSPIMYRAFKNSARSIEMKLGNDSAR